MNRIIGYIIITVLLVFIGCRFSESNAESMKCIQLYYDRADKASSKYYFGRIHTILLQNLLGHFPNYQQVIRPIENYKSGQLENCEASFYLGTYYDAEIPDAFIKDYIKTKKNVVWAGYQIWKIPKEELASLWGVEFTGLSALDYEKLDAKGRPGFFKSFTYQEEVFNKFGDFDLQNRKSFLASFEIVLFKLLNAESSKYVVSWAQHSTQEGVKSPYILKNQNHWYVADSPFSFATEEDRYLILADILFDVLNEKPRRQDNNRPALFRLEDIHPKLQLWQLYQMTDLLYKHKVPFSMTVIPIFTDPLGVAEEKIEDRFVPITQNRNFVDFLKYAEERGGSVVFHGVTHQYGTRPNPFTAMSGDDFEFWDRVHNIPVDRDSASYVVNRIEEGRHLFSDVGINPIAWVTPHYQASPLDYLIFSRLFNWSIGRMIYFPFSKTGSLKLPANLNIESPDRSLEGQRLKYFDDLKVEFPKVLLPSGQFYPYEVFGDVYGQRIIPENVGNVQAYLNEQVLRTLTIHDMVRIMKRNRKMRDAWASFFLHPFLLEETSNEGLARFVGDVSAIEALIEGTRKAGYEFVDLKKWIGSQPLLRTPEALEEF